MTVLRAAWGFRRTFTPKERKDLCAILKLPEKEAREFLDAVEQQTVRLSADWQICGDVPPETSSSARKTLARIATHAEELRNALKELDPLGSMYYLHKAWLRTKLPTFPGISIDELNQLQMTAEIAIEIARGTKAGRPKDLVERWFIIAVAGLVRKHLKKRITYSRGSWFPRFIAQVLAFVLPGNPHTAGDNSKLIRIALTESKIID